MVLRRRRPWAVALLAALAATAIVGAWHGIGWHAPPRAVAPPVRLGAEPAAGPPVATAKVCVTRHGLCPAAAVRAGDPCGCPHPLRGTVLGHVERVGGRPVRPGGGDWSRPEDDPSYDRDVPVAP